MKWLSLKFGGQKWRVDLVRSNHPQLRDGDSRCHGVTLREACKIYIDKGQSETVLEDTLLHELLHAALYVSRGHHKLLELCGDEKKAEDTEEALVEGLVLVLHPLLKEMGFRFPKVNQ